MWHPANVKIKKKWNAWCSFILIRLVKCLWRSLWKRSAQENKTFGSIKKNIYICYDLSSLGFGGSGKTHKTKTAGQTKHIYSWRWHVVPLTSVKPNCGALKKIYRLFHSCFGIMCWWQATHTTAEPHRSTSTHRGVLPNYQSGCNTIVFQLSLKALVLELETNEQQTGHYHVWWFKSICLKLGLNMKVLLYNILKTQTLSEKTWAIKRWRGSRRSDNQWNYASCRLEVDIVQQFNESTQLHSVFTFIGKLLKIK